MTSRMILAVILAGAPGSALATTTIYAGPGGTGTACTFSVPCSLVQARDLARTLIPTMTGDIHVVLFDGT